jgi:hypothetical protein
MTEPSFHAEPAPSGGHAVLMRVALAWIACAVAVTVVELVTVGRLVPVGVVVDIIAAFLLPFPLLWFVVAFVLPGGEPPRGDDDDNGRGRPPDDPDSGPPSGGLDIDWEQFEADVYAYAQSQAVVA